MCLLTVIATKKWPVDTTAKEGDAVSLGRPLGTTKEVGYGVISERPVGTTADWRDIVFVRRRPACVNCFIEGNDIQFCTKTHCACQQQSHVLALL